MNSNVGNAQVYEAGDQRFVSMIHINKVHVLNPPSERRSKIIQVPRHMKLDRRTLIKTLTRSMSKLLVCLAYGRLTLYQGRA